MFSHGHSLPKPLIQQFPVPVIQGWVTRRVARNHESRQIAALDDGLLARARAGDIDPPMFLENLVSVRQRDVVRKALEQVEMCLVKHCVFGAVQVDDRAGQRVVPDLFTRVPCSLGG